MSLQRIPTSYETVTIEGAEFKIRPITRAEAARCQKLVGEGTDVAELEVLVLSYATDTDETEVRDWYASTPSGAVDELLNAIRDLSKLDEGAQKSG